MKLTTRTNPKTLVIAVLLALANNMAAAAPVGTLTTFTAGTTALAAQVNDNFTTVSAAVNDNNSRIGTIEATVIGGNVVLVPSTATTGNIMKGANSFIHNYGINNTFLGVLAGNYTMTGAGNTATGASALRSNSTGGNNTANGVGALYNNISGAGNTAIGSNSLPVNTIGGINTAIGVNSLANNSTGNNNTALGAGALWGNTTGGNNIAIGLNAGVSLTTGDNNILIGHAGGAGNIGTTRIGTAGTTTSTFIAGIRGVTTATAAIPVLIGTDGQLGTISSSQRVKDDITDMGEASSTLMKLRPVTFHYKTDQNPKGRSLQYGLIAEEVEKVAPSLVARNAKGEIETVFYQHLTPMLLNEYQKQQRTIDMQTAELKKQTIALAQQTLRVAALEKQGQEIVALKQELARMAAVLARLGQPEKVASISR